MELAGEVLYYLGAGNCQRTQATQLFTHYAIFLGFFFFTPG